MKSLLCWLIMALGGATTLSAQTTTIVVTVSFDQSSGLQPITLLSFKLGAVQPALTTYSGAGASAAKSQFTPLTLYKNIDQNTPLLFLDCATGKPIKSALLTVSQSTDGQTPAVFFEVALQNVFIASVNDESANADASPPFETFTLTYGKIGWQYSPLAGGKVVNGGFDVKKNTTLNWSQVNNQVEPD